MINRFNRLTSKEWLPFQKSWFKFTDFEKFFSQNLRFFTKAEPAEPVYYFGKNMESISKAATDNQLVIISEPNTEIQFACINLLETITPQTSLSEYQVLKKQIMKLVSDIYDKLIHRRFLNIIIANQCNNKYLPFAWDLAKSIALIFSLKDEKIACLETPLSYSTFYSLYFRKDENSKNQQQTVENYFFKNNTSSDNSIIPDNKIPSWYILKPQPRKKNEILHPAKYPEDLVEMHIKQYTREGENVFDPMTGTGSTQVGALKLGRNAYGTELSEFFTEIAINRCLEQQEKNNCNFKILCKDARNITKKDFPEFDYIITSPPYWDMLNMKGAENQAKRVEKGLRTNYSENNNDIGNIADYNLFLSELTQIYIKIIKLLKPGKFITIVVKNIKKKGSNYPFAWDLAQELQNHAILMPETFWCQDDLSIAPYGFGNTWVSNTFHHYALTFQKKL